MVFYRCFVVERRECVGRALSAFVLFRLEIRILIWKSGVPVGIIIVRMLDVSLIEYIYICIEI